MAHLFTRSLTFLSNDLGNEASIMLTFDGDMEGLYEDFFPVVWKVSTFGEAGSYAAKATYTSQLAFSKPQVRIGNIINAETCVKINDGEKTTLTEADGVYQFSAPQAGTTGVLEAMNSTGAVQDIAVGFMSMGQLMPTPALYFNGVGDKSHVTAKFTPVLRAYITSDYQETAILRGAIDTPAIWSRNLAELAPSTTWILTHDPASGKYTIAQA
ncbi:hypothetical protein EV702DRAFT_1137405 [Suillus placidus]|uniref:Uncharacterized protein n=1 Tax=Suillus placidus TaxID=48579 RepID=A0A9P6ZLZ1_9AGAM|nr:hypothetical protein EV702DRAFT_1137405 [Suillus placidus]